MNFKVLECCVFAAILFSVNSLILDGTQSHAQSDHGEILHLKSLVDGLVNLTNAIQQEVASKNDLTQFLRVDVQTLNQTLHIEIGQRKLLDARIRSLESKLRSLGGDNEDLSDNIGLLQQQTGILQTGLNTANQQLTTLSNQNHNLNQTVQNQLSTLTTTLNTVQTSITKLSAPKTENHLHFTAKRPSNPLSLSNTRLQFSKLESSPSNITVFSLTTGVFTAPWKGAYWFGVTLSAVTTDYVQCSLVRNNRDFLADIFTSSAGESTIGSQTTTSLNAGDHIEVSHCHGNGEIDQYKTTFSGIFINAE